MSRELPPMLEQAVRDGVMTREHAEKVDAWAEDLAKRHVRGEVSDEDVSAMTAAKAFGDALAVLGADVVIIVRPEEEKP